MTAARATVRRITYHPRKPGRIWRVLATVANHPAGITSVRVAEALLPPAVPYRSAEDWRARQRARQALRGHVSRDVRKLAGRGYLRSAVGPRLDPAELALYRSRGWDAFRSLDHVVDAEGYIVGRVPQVDTGRGRFRRAIVEILADHPDGLPVADLLRQCGGLTAGGRECGTWRAAMSELIDTGTVIPSRARYVTPAGLAQLVAR
jgi:hypothetical protein